MSKNVPTANTTSVNWSGYAVETNLASPQAYAFTDVQATWIVPSVGASASSSHNNAYSSTWIGLDGDSSNSKTVEQIGIEQDFINGKAVYYAWYEMYPKAVVKLDLVIQAGDTISAEVKYLGNNTYQLTLDDVTSGHSSAIQIESAKPIRSSAEWIEEGTGRVADFNTVTFTNAQATATKPTGTTTGSISDPAWQTEEVTLVSKSGGVIATPTALSNDGSSFSINYVANSNQVATLAASGGAHGPNDDKFVFGHGSGDTINDYLVVGSTATEHDVIDVQAYGFSDWSALQAVISDDIVSGNAVIHLSTNDAITLVGVHTADLLQTDFII
jgi:Peptidase A4 family